MNNYQEIEGNLITLAQEGAFDVIAHGCNCFSTMGAGIAPQMAKAFGCDNYPLEKTKSIHPINKLGQIDYIMHNVFIENKLKYTFAIVNAYSQYHFGHKNGPPFDLEAFTLCMRKMNHIFKGKHIGLPQIGAGLAGGKWGKIQHVIMRELTDCKVTVVIYKP
jgi:O-acetyl-ADP-ribose deacetylase (regulator of RNase III)